jgi:aminodeoxyfutalosine synthase
MQLTIQPDRFPEPLQDLAAKVREGVRLEADDALLCFTTPHVLYLGKLANEVRRRLHGDIAYFNINRHINPTNVCVYTYDCKFCGFAAVKGEEHAWEMSHEDVWAEAAKQGGDSVTEFHIVGGLHPDLSLEWYCEMLSGLKSRFPNAHLKAFTAIEIGWFAQREKISIEEVLARLRDSGLGSLPGGGAEIFDAGIRQQICNGKLDAEEWIEVHRIAHGMGTRRNAGIQLLHPSCLPPREQLHGPALPHHRHRGLASSCHVPPGARQHPAPESVLDHDHAETGTGGSLLRR